MHMEHRFYAILDIIGINPFVAVPDTILEKVFAAAGRASGPVPVRGTVNGKPYIQTLVRFRGDWRLYINLIMLPDSPRRIGEELKITIEYDPADRSIPMPGALERGFNENEPARKIYDSLRPSLQKEIVRYIAALKSDAAIGRNVQRAIDFLNGKGRFIGRGSIHD